MIMEDFTIQVSASFWFIFLAYICAFLPWTALASRDFLGPTWDTVRNARVAGRYNVGLTVIPACYIVAYIVIQGLSSQYTEMCAALVALVFSALHLLRTLWGLWQLRCFRHWAHNSIDALRAMGVPYRLTIDGSNTEEDSTATTAEIVERLLVNETIVDNQIIHGKVRCFIKYAHLTMHGGSASDSPPVKCFKSLNQGFRILHCFLRDQAGALFGLRKRHRITQVPFQPVEVWLNWSVPFAAQGLSAWMKEFNVPLAPNHSTLHNRDTSARERLDRRAEYFSFQLLNSAWLQLWSELGLPLDREGRSPLHWVEWDKFDENSKLAKGLVSKDELLKRAMSSGEALPFGASHGEVLEKDWVKEPGYGAYGRMLQQVVNELPVRREFDAQVEEFEIEKLEWLTILLDLGNIALRKKNKQRESDRKSSGRSTNLDPGEQDFPSGDAGHESNANSPPSSLHDEAGYESVSTKSSKPGLDDALPQNITDVVPPQALENLRKQLNIGICSYESGSTDSGGTSSAMFQCLSIAGWWRSGDWLNHERNENRHAMKVGEMTDVWMALLGGDQISFMNEMNGSEFWDKLCRFAVDPSSGEEMVVDYSTEKGEAMQMIHAEVEKRRLCYDLANPMPSCEHLEQFVTFMGYSMETVRSRLGMWLRDQKKGSVPQDSFRPFVETADSVTVDLKLELSELLTEDGGEPALNRRGVQTRLLWELQRGMAREENKGPECISNIALCILSYPSLCIVAEKGEVGDAEIVQGDDSVIVQFRDVWRFKVRVMGAPQRFELSGKLWRRGKSVSATISVRSGQGEKRFEWQMWRDAFLGRLMGLKHWQERRGIRNVELQNTVGRMEQGVGEVNASTGEKIQSWAGWQPFRFEFLRFELESDGLLQHQSLQTVTHNLYNSFVPSNFKMKTQRQSGRTTKCDETLVSVDAWINQVRTVPVEYGIASPEVLRHAYLLVEEALTTNGGVRPIVPDDGVSSLMRRAEKCLTETNDTERAVLLFETAASVNGNGEALERCIELLLGDITNRRAPGRVVNLMERFIAKLVSEGGRQGLQMSYREARKVSTCYHKVIARFGDLPKICSRLLLVLESYLYVDQDKFTDSVVSGLQIMYCMSKDEEILLLLAKILATHASKPLHAKIYNALEIASSKKASSWIGKELGNDITRFSIKLHRTILSKTKGYVSQRTAFSLATVLQDGTNRTARNLQEAEALYRRAIDETGDVYAMVNLGNLLRHGADGVAPNPQEAEALYRRAIDEVGYVPAMNNLGLLLRHGAGGLAEKPQEAEALFRRVIDEDEDFIAMVNLGELLMNGASGVPANPREAELLFRRAIDEGKSVQAMINLGNLLSIGGVRMPAKPQEAEALYRRAIDENGHVQAMFNLGNLLLEGADGVTAKPEEAESLYRRAIDEGGIVDAMYNLGNLLRYGADGVSAKPQEAAALYRRAIEEGELVGAMNNLGSLLQNGADGVAANPKEAEALYRRAMDKDEHVTTMYNLGNLLMHGAEGVSAKPGEAAALYRRAIEEGEHIGAMKNLGFLLQNRADGVKTKPQDADAPYRRAVDNGGHVDAMYSLGNLLRSGADGVAANPQEAATLYRRAIDEGGHVEAMYNLADLLRSGADGVTASPKEAEGLYRRAIDEGGHIRAVNNLGTLLWDGADEVAANPQEAEALYRRSIHEGGNVTAMFNLGDLLRFGADGVEGRPEETEKFYRRAIDEGGHIDAMNNLAELLREGAKGVTAKPQESEVLWRRAIHEGGHIRALNNLGNLLWDGADGVAKNPREAAALYRRATESGDVDAMLSLGFLLQYGAEGVAARPQEAQAMYRRAINEAGHIKAMNNLGNLLWDGADGVAPNPQEAEKLYRRAIDEGRDVHAMNNLGLLLRDGADGVVAKPSEAEALYRRAIDEGGYVEAVYNLGLLLQEGADGVAANPKEAEALFRRAIDDSGDIDAMMKLAGLLESGAQGSSVNAAEAAHWYRRAADEGQEADAMYKLGRILEQGAEGVERDIGEAVKLYNRAIAEGNDVRVMYRLAGVLETGEEGVAADVEHAMKLYEQAGEHEDAKERLRALRERIG